MREEKYEMPVLTDGQRGAAIEDLRTEVKALQARIDCAELNDTYIPRVRERLLYAQIALASLTAVPVGYTCQSELDGLKKGKTTRIVSYCTNGDPIPVYTTSPVPSVPEDE